MKLPTCAFEYLILVRVELQTEANNECQTQHSLTELSLFSKYLSIYIQTKRIKILCLMQSGPFSIYQINWVEIRLHTLSMNIEPL